MIRINKDIINNIPNDADLGKFVRSLTESDDEQYSIEYVMDLVTMYIRSAVKNDLLIEVMATALISVSEGSSIEVALLESLEEWDIS